MDTASLIAFYVNLLVIQYKTLPNATGTIQALATEVVASQIYNQVLNGFNLFPANGFGTAIGEQLNILGDYVGAPRTIFGYDPTIPYFALYAYATTPPLNVGFASYSDVTDPVDNWLSYTTGQTAYVLTDGQLLQLIQYLIAVHASNHTLASIDNILQTFFTTYCILIDNENMTIVYQHSLSDPNFLFSIVNQLGLLPHPAGVQINVVEV